MGDVSVHHQIQLRCHHGSTFKVEDNEKTGGYTVTVVGYPGIFVNWHPATQDDYEWIRLQKLSPTDGKSQIAPVVKNKN